MKQSYLIQRLHKPLTGRFAEVSNAFSFGGGLRNGGLTKEAAELLNEVWSFDYMGSAEFEWGAVPEALNKMANRDDLIAYSVDVTAKCRNWREKKDIKVNGKVYVISPAEWREEVEDRIRYHAAHEFGKGDYSTKECVNLAGSLCEVDKWVTRNVGWLELDNGYFFFTSEEMFDKVVQLFSLTKEHEQT